MIHQSGSWSFFYVAIGAIAGGLVTFIFNIVRMGLDTHAKRCDELCEDIREAANLASEYWLSNINSDISTTIPAASRSSKASKALAEERTKAQVLEAQIQGLTTGILAQIEGVQEPLGRDATDQINQKCSEFIDATTGGAFSARDGTPDPKRALSSQTVAANLISVLRLGVLKASGFWFLVRRFLNIH